MGGGRVVEQDPDSSAGMGINPGWVSPGEAGSPGEGLGSRDGEGLLGVSRQGFLFTIKKRSQPVDTFSPA